MNARVLGAALIVALAGSGCTSGDNPPRCSLETGTAMASLDNAAWPRYRRDPANTGHIAGVDLTQNPGTLRWRFPDEGLDIGPITAGALVGPNDRVYLPARSPERNSTDVVLYVFDGATGEILVRTARPTPILSPTPGPTPTPGPPLVDTNTRARSAPVLGADDSLFLALENGIAHRLDADGEDLMTASAGGSVLGSPALGNDGTYYLATADGIVTGLCPNGVPRFSVLAAPSEAAVALVSEEYCAVHFEREEDCPVAVVAGEDGRVAAFDIRGRARWSMFLAEGVAAGAVLDEDNDRFYATDRSGLVLSGRLSDGRRRQEFRFQADAPVLAPPALAAGRLYLGDLGGTLSALDADTGSRLWALELGSAIRSAPAVASTDEEVIVIVGADDGVVRAVADRDDHGEVLWAFDTGAPIGKAPPAIGFDGTVYLGNEGGVFYAIGSPVATPTPSATTTPEAAATPTATEPVVTSSAVALRGSRAVSPRRF